MYKKLIIVITMPDTPDYKQADRDIKTEHYIDRVIQTTNYYEVKTHSKHSMYKKPFIISNEQMIKALETKGNFFIFHSIYDNKEKKCIEHSILNLIEEILNRNIIDSYKYYEFYKNNRL